MNDRTRSIFVLIFILVVFGLAFTAHDIINDSYLRNQPEIISTLEEQNEALQEKVDELREQNSALKKQVEDLQDKDKEESDE